MVFTARNTRHVTRTLYAGKTETITLLKRNLGQRQSVVVALKLFRCRRSKIAHTGQPIETDETVGTVTSWHIPRTELDRVGVNFLSALDRIVDKNGRYWQAESTTMLDVKLFENEVDLECLRVDPPEGG